MTEQDTGALGPSGRFARMEGALERIESKLDQKVDVKDFARLEGRLGALEVSIADAMSGKTTTALGALYMQQFTDMKASIEKLEQDARDRAVLEEAAKGRVDSRFRWTAAAFGALSGLSVLISIYGAVT